MNKTSVVTGISLVLLALGPIAAVAQSTKAGKRAKRVKVKVIVDSQAPGYEGVKALDGDPRTMWHTRFGAGETAHPHQMVADLGASYEIAGFGYLARPGGGNGTIKGYEFYISDDPKNFGRPVSKGSLGRVLTEQVVSLPVKKKGRYVQIRAISEVAGRPWASIAELRILSEGVEFRAAQGAHGRLAAETVDRTAWQEMGEIERRFETLKQDLRNRARFDQVAQQTFRPEALLLDSDRDPVDLVLRRTAALLADLKQTAAVGDLAALENRLEQLEAAGRQIAVEDAEERFTLFEKVCVVRRRIALSNPLLNFDKILFITRHRPGFNHMCDQYYGINAKPGGGLYVLHDPFGPNPRVEDVLADSVVQRGRLKGRKLTDGSFVSPDLSYDGRSALFAYVECEGDRSHRHHTDPTRGHWDEGWSYHVFKVNVDGTGLEQLTDGTWNDFDPCWLPNGRVAFITERRGGYLRCGRVCPTYTLFDMKPDGGDIRCLSFHETNEWHPSVTHDGRIIYTRWDYIDRHGCTAHLPWITTLDGRDSRAVHGNFAPRPLRPDMELDCRSIPGSHKFVATAAPHHGQAFGSLVLVDPHVEDDDAMAPVKRITPEIRFPESQGGSQVYGTAWPLSESYYLCVYDVAMKPGMAQQGGANLRGDYGIYLVDCFGNKELIHRDPEIACQSPIPLRSRPKPPAPVHVAEGPSRNPSVPAAQARKPATGTLAVVNVYDGLKPWPEKTKITALRVLQVLPMTVPSGGPPHETGLRLPSAGDSVVPARYVLGTVPVEEDGSAHFTAPAHMEMFFQALDEQGLAVQSMRSSTYLQAGERLVCQGCHERRHRIAQIPPEVPRAFRRGPSRLEPDVDGSNPFSYPRLVQPVLDRHCVKCHAERADEAPNLAREPIQRRWYASYHSLAPKFGFYNYGDGYRTTPGRFGARASKLYELLKKGHYEVELSAEEMHRITLWLDCCSMFYGVYEKEGGEAQLRGEIARPTLE